MKSAKSKLNSTLPDRIDINYKTFKRTNYKQHTRLYKLLRSHFLSTYALASNQMLFANSSNFRFISIKNTHIFLQKPIFHRPYLQFYSLRPWLALYIILFPLNFIAAIYHLPTTCGGRVCVCFNWLAELKCETRAKVQTRYDTTHFSIDEN